jgi:hypothetical protein
MTYFLSSAAFGRGGEFALVANLGRMNPADAEQLPHILRMAFEQNRRPANLPPLGRGFLALIRCV